MQDTAELFLSALARDDYEHAHRFLATTLARDTSVEGLRRFVARTGLQSPGRATWDDAVITGEQASLAGKVAVDGEGASIPVRFSYGKEGMHWKIVGLQRGVDVATTNGVSALYAPADVDSALLARQTTATFADAVNRDDLDSFWLQMAGTFKAQYPAEAFADAFAGFVRDRTNLAPAAKIDPAFSAPPTVSPSGELVLSGVFPTEPSRVAFEYRYLMEDGKWTSSGITINVAPSDRR